MRRCEIVILTTIFIASCALQLNAQPSLKDFVPPSPNTAALGQYGKVGVGLNRGDANISVPLHEIKVKDLELAIDLSYHGGGIKVEEASTWVGLGWTLNAGGVITRELRNKPDEIGVGYMNCPHDSDLIMEEEYGGLSPSELAVFLDVVHGNEDLEPDMFYFNVGAHSGKFMYNKAAAVFETIPASKKKITYDNPTMKWKMVVEDGTTYYFGSKEQNTASSFCFVGGGYQEQADPLITTGWYVDQIINANGTEEINFSYESDIYTFNTIIPRKKALTTTGGCGFLGFDYGPSCELQNLIVGQRLTEITYTGGRIVFDEKDVVRCDMDGDYALDKIEIYNEKNELFLTYNFHQTYFKESGTPCAVGTEPEDFRLRLDSLTRSNGGKTELYRKFDYQGSFVPNRKSYAQDYWGYYNGVTTNNDLIPSVFIQTFMGQQLWQGANREASTDMGKVGMAVLTKMHYPTGGYTQFEYENHRVQQSFAPQYENKAVFLRNLTNPPPPNAVWDTTIVINEPPSELNGFHIDGGAYVDILVTGIGCTYGPVATTGCAELYITGPQATNITQDIHNYYMQNGTYVLTADFHTNPNPEQYLEFFIEVKWKHLDEQNGDNSAIGGLRIKKISDYDPVVGQVAYQREYLYTFEREHQQPLKSSASMTGPPVYKTEMVYKSRCGLGSGNIETCQRYEVSVGSNYPVVGLGNPITYSYVTVLEDDDGVNGKTVHEFTTVEDEPYIVLPYSPPITREWKRGHPFRIREYKKPPGHGYSLVKETRYHYKEINKHNLYGIRIAPKTVCADGATGTSFIDMGYYAYERYRTENGYYYNDSIQTKTYLEGGLWQSYETKFIDPDNLTLTRSEVPDSKNDKIVTWYKYARDYVFTGTDGPSQGIVTMKAKNMNPLIEKTSWRKSGSDSTLLSADLNIYASISGKAFYKKFLQRFGPLPSFTPSTMNTTTFIYDDDYVVQTEFLSFDSKGNPLDYKQKDGVVNALIWSPNKVYPIALGKGGSANDFRFEGFEYATTDVSSTARSGTQSHSGTHTMSLPAGQHKVTYWQKTGAGAWQFFETSTSLTSITIGVSGSLIDDVCVSPAGGQMTTYTYKPGFGVSSATDPANKTTFYEYDEFGRLIVVRDHKGRVVKTNKYHLLTNN